MSKEQLVQRLLCSEGLVDAHGCAAASCATTTTQARPRGGPPGHGADLDRRLGDALPLAMRSKARRLKAEHDVGLVVVDYLQMMQGPSDSESRQQEISFISRSLKALAKELDVPVVALSAALPGAGAAPAASTGVPSSRDLRESGAIEQDADVVCSSIARSSTTARSIPRRTKASRESPSSSWGSSATADGTVKLFFRKEYTRFDNYHAARIAHRGRPCLREARCSAAPTAARTSPSGADAARRAGHGITLVEEPVGRTGGRADRRSSTPSGRSARPVSAVGAAGFERCKRSTRVRFRAGRRHRPGIRWCWWARSPASASLHCCCSARRGSSRRACPRCTCPVKNRPIRSGCAPSG